jgi:hypothetical protein
MSKLKTDSKNKMHYRNIVFGLKIKDSLNYLAMLEIKCLL